MKLTKKITGLTAPTRKGAECTAKWEIPAKCKKDDADGGTRFDGIEIDWVFDAGKQNKGIKKSKGDVVHRDTTNKNTQQTDTEKFPRSSFYPKKGKPKLINAEIWVRGYNYQRIGGKRVRRDGPFVHKALKFDKPAKPTVTLSYDESAGEFSVNIKAKNVDGAKERYDTVVNAKVHTTKKLSNATTADTDHTWSHLELASAHNLGIGDWRKARATAYNRGLAGDSGEAEAVMYVLHPNPPECGTPELVYATQGELTTASVRVPVNKTGNAKDGKTKIEVQELTLQRLKNSQTTSAQDASTASGWTDVQTDDGTCKGLTDTWADGVSDPGTYTWYRLAAKSDGYTTYSVPVHATCIDRAGSPVSTGTAVIDSAVPGTDGHSVALALSGKEPDDEGYEVSWSDASDAWESTDPPSAFMTAGSRLVVKGLDEGVQYFFRARAYDTDNDGNFIYGDYSDPPAIAIPASTPSSVALTGAAITARGQNLVLTWTWNTEAAQTNWRLVDTGGTARFSGKGGDASRIITPREYGNASSLSLRVEMTSGGGWARSQFMTFRIADPPTCTITAPATATAQPIAFTVTSDTGDDVRVALTALGSSGTGLYGDAEQFAGDTVYSGIITPTWTGSGSSRAATVSLPSGQTLFDGAQYLIEVSAIDAATGLESAAASSTFAIAWAHKAQQPTVGVTVDSDELTATVTVDAPQDYATGDRFDLYRMTPDGERRIASAQPFGTAITDRFAPYTHDGSGLAYVAVTRTADGDACVSDDAPYSLACKSLRFDWGGGNYVELPYDIQLEDTIENDAEVRKHLDAMRQPYANGGYMQRSSLSTNLIRFEDREQQELVRDMLHHEGSVFVRTPDGMAFAAQVTPGTIARSAETALTGASFQATEHDLTDENRPGDADIAQPAWTGGAIEEHGGVIYDAVGEFPMDDWMFIGYASSVLYAYDPNGAVRDGDGSEMDGWTWNGETLYDDNGDAVETTEES